MKQVKKRMAGAIIALVLLGGAAALLVTTRATQSDRRPVARHARLLPSSEVINVSKAEESYREQITRHPERTEGYVALAQLYLQQARETAREYDYVPRAQALVDQALGREPDDYHALLLKGTLLNKLHHFEEARSLAAALIDRHPGHAYPYGILVDALVELGRYPEAVAACDTMLALRPGLSSYARAAYQRELHGDVAGAERALRLAADAGLSGRADRAWALYQLGMLYVSQGDVQRARLIFNGILEERSQFTMASAGLAWVDVVEGNYERAVRLARNAYAAAPNAHLLTILAEAYTLLGDDDALRRTLGEIQTQLDRSAAMGERVRMELADFLADHDLRTGDAVRMARQEYERRPNHLHALETYAWTLYKAGQPETAVPIIERAMRLGNQDAEMQYRAGIIYDAAGQRHQAMRHLRLALQSHLAYERPSKVAKAETVLARLAAGQAGGA